MNHISLPGLIVAIGLLTMIAGIDMKKDSLKEFGRALTSFGFILNAAAILAPYLNE